MFINHFKVRLGTKNRPFWPQKKEERTMKKTAKKKPVEKPFMTRDTILNTKQVSHILDCSPDDVIVLAQRGLLRATKQGRFWRIRYGQVLAYRDAHKMVANGG